MKIEFKYNRFTQNCRVRIDGKPVSVHSAFAAYDGSLFFSWFENLPELCRKEAGGDYQFRFWGSPLETMMLKQIFAQDPHCISFSAKEEYITLQDRMRWARELIPFMKNPPKAKLCIDSVNAQENAKALQSYVRPFTGGSVEVVCDSRNPDIVFAGDQKRVSELSHATKPVCLVIHADGRPGYISGKGSCHVFHADLNKVEEFLNCWMDEEILCSLLQEFENISLSTDDRLLLRKQKMLTKMKPFIELCVSSDRLTMSETGSWSVIRLPENHPCTVQSETPEVLRISDGGKLIPVKEGNGCISVTSTLIRSLKCEKHLEVSDVRRIKDITLYKPTSQIFKGQQFSVAMSFAPAEAVNQNQIRWSVSPAGILQIDRTDQKAGHFTALAEGRCTIQASVNNVSASVTVDILPAAKTIKLSANDLKLKPGQKGMTLTHTVEPANAPAKVIYDFSNPAVADVSKNGQVNAYAEGTCIVSATLLDANGCAVDEDRCLITVLPLKEVYTPTLWDAALLIALLGIFVARREVTAATFTGISVAAAVYGAFKAKKGWPLWIYGALAMISAGVLVLRMNLAGQIV